MVAPPLCAWWHHRVVFWPRKMALLSNLKAVLICLITFTNPSFGLSGCQCCMISVEHGLELLKAGLDLYINMYPKCPYMLLPSPHVKPQYLPCGLLRLRVDSCHSEGVRRWLLQWKQASCHTNCCHVHSF